MFAKQGVIAADMQDAATRALAGQDYLVQEAKSQIGGMEANKS